MTKTVSGVHIETARATELFDIEKSEPRPGWPTWANLRFRPRRDHPREYAGGGVYAIAYRRQLLYVGKFTGRANVPFAGDAVTDRFWKHLEALTMRGRSIGFSPKNFDVSIAMDESPIVSAIRQHAALRGYDRVRTYPCKVKFAAEHWSDFEKLETDPGPFEDFEFFYARVSPPQFCSDVSYSKLKNYIGVIEDDLILELRPRCNVRFHRSDRAHLSIGPSADEWNEFKDLVRDIAPPTAKHDEQLSDWPF